MNYAIVIPAHNEEDFLQKTLFSIINQTLLPQEVIVVNDNSSDHTEKIIDRFAAENSFILKKNSISAPTHLPGGKVVRAFYEGYRELKHEFDFVVKLDADIILPPHYFETIAKHFSQNPRLGICGGLCYINKNNKWVYENIADKNHVRGPIKAYSKKCFEAIGGLKQSIGWDTVDVLLAKYQGFAVKTDKNLWVKHLKPTGQAYHKKAKLAQGEAMYKMRYGLIITVIAALKLSFFKKDIRLPFTYLAGYFAAKKAHTPFLVSEEEGRWIRTYRWKKIRQKISKKQN